MPRPERTAAEPNPPEIIRSEAELDELLSRPGPALIEAITQVHSPLLVLGAGGKMGPSLCLLARRAAEAAQHSIEVVAVSRFSDPRAREWFERHRIRVVAGDLLNRHTYSALPDSQNIIYLVGLKFGTQQNPALTWAINTLVPSYVAERYPGARIVALSTGNVYPYVQASSGGARETEPPRPVGEYASAALARERIFEHYARTQGTVTVLLRLNYAVELRYGVLLDIARTVWANEAIDLHATALNCLWQGDANDMILRALPLAAAPPALFNLTGPDTLAVRDLAEGFGHLMQRQPRFVGSEAPTALLSNSSELCARLGAPPTPLTRMMKWIADWVMHGGATLGKPTHFEVRTGEY